MTMIVVKGAVPVDFKGTIIDLETTGLSPRSNVVITVGILHGTCFKVFQASESGEIPMDFGPYLRNLPRPRYAFNKGFEESFLGFELDEELQSKPFERKTEALFVRLLHDPLDRRGELVPREWEAYLKTADRMHLQRIIDHNISDLLEELCLALVKSSRTLEVADVSDNETVDIENKETISQVRTE